MTAFSGLYIHFPFCKKKCPYCDFYSIASLNKTKEWLKTLEKEFQFWKKYWPHQFDTIYFGGGTPSLLKEEDLAFIFNLIYKNFKIDFKPETTLEVNPENITSKELKTWQRLGINRLSLGLQSFNLSDLQFLERNHQPEEGYNLAALALDLDFKISLDLIYGLPKQSLNSWLNNLKKVVQLKPQHISTYGLKAEPKTKLYQQLKQKKIPPLANEDEFSKLYLGSADFLKNHNYQRYEVSNFALINSPENPKENPKENQAKHNLKYWQRKNYLGLGPSAHSFLNEIRYQNPSSLLQWQKQLENKATWLQKEHLSLEDIQLEKIMLGLRLSEGFKASKKIITSELVKNFIKNDYLRLSNGYLQATEKGFLISDYLTIKLSAIV